MELITSSLIQFHTPPQKSRNDRHYFVPYQSVMAHGYSSKSLFIYRLLLFMVCKNLAARTYQRRSHLQKSSFVTLTSTPYFICFFMIVLAVLLVPTNFELSTTSRITLSYITLPSASLFMCRMDSSN